MGALKLKGKSLWHGDRRVFEITGNRSHSRSHGVTGGFELWYVDEDGTKYLVSHSDDDPRPPGNESTYISYFDDAVRMAKQLWSNEAQLDNAVDRASRVWRFGGVFTERWHGRHENPSHKKLKLYVCVVCGKRSLGTGPHWRKIAHDCVCSQKCEDDERSVNVLGWPPLTKRHNPCRHGTHDQPGYKWFVVIRRRDGSGGIESGWEFKDDAHDQETELYPFIGARELKSVKVVHRRVLPIIGLDPADDCHWTST